MTQQPLGRNPTPQIQRLAQIDDTVAGYRYIIDDFHQIVHRLATCTPAPPPVRLSAPAQGALVVQGGEVTTEDLGTQIMSGVTVTGRRQTITFPPGTYQGNDAPVTRVQETWRSAQYGLEFLTKSTNPQGDTNSQTMSKFTPGEPDPALFLPPPGYRIVDETAPFTIRIPYQPPQ